MSTRLKILVLSLLCAVGLRAQPGSSGPYQLAGAFGIWANKSNSFWTNIWVTNYGVGTRYFVPFTNAIPTNGLPPGTADYSVSPTNLNLLNQQNVTFTMIVNVVTNPIAGGVGWSQGTISNLTAQFYISSDYAFWSNMGQTSNATWVTNDPNYILAFPLSSNLVSTEGAWTNSGWTNFSTKGFQTIQFGNWKNTSTNLIVTNPLVEYYYK